MVSAWVSRLAEIQTALRLSPGVLGLALLAAAVGALIATPLSGVLIDREGSGMVTWQGSLGFCLALPLLALAANVWWLAAALFVFGFTAGAMDVGMNAQAVAVEEQHRRSIMSSFHALFSAGGMIGSALGGWIASWHIAPLPHFAGAALVLAGTVLVVARNFLPDHAQPHERPPLVPNRIPLPVLGLAAIAFTFFMTEGAIADWSAIYLREFLHTGPGRAALGYSAFSLTMALGRWFGDGIIERLGRRRTLQAFSLLASSGIGLALIAPVFPLALVGFAVAGAGCCVIVPVAFAASGRVEGMSKGGAMAAVTGFGYLGLLLGPPLIGFLAQAASLRWALVLVVALSAGGSLIARSVRN